MFGRKKASKALSTYNTVRTKREKEVAAIPAGSTGRSRVEEELLARHSDRSDEIESWRIFKIMAELVEGFEVLRNYDLAATIFGTSRCQFGDEVYAQAEELAGRLANEGFAIITGGGGGVMNAANRGAKEVGGESIGLNIELPSEQRPNEHLTDGHEFHYFFTRKVMLSFASEVYVFFPGGFGTLDEFFEIMTLVQTKKIKRIPIILIGEEYWSPLISWFEHTLYAQNKAINKKDMEIYHLVDTVDEAMKVIKRRLKT